MEYSITALAKQARVTVRTLRHYDEIGLLKPSVRMSSGRRIYGEEQFWRLFEIVFFRRIGLSLAKIKGIFLSKPSDKAITSVLVARREELAKEIERLQRYAASIDMAIPYYKNCAVGPKEKLDKCRALQNTMKEVEEMQIKEFGKKKIANGKEKADRLSMEEVDERVEKSNQLMKDAIQAIEQGLKPNSGKVQALIKRYYDLLTEYNPVTREIFLKLKETVLEHKELYTRYHPKMPEFLYEAMGIFAENSF